MSNFQEMNARQIAEAIMRTQDPNDVTPQFLELENLNPGVSTEVVNRLERAAISDIGQAATMVGITRMMTEITGQPLDLYMTADEASLRQMQVATQVYMNVAALKGDAADPLVKAYAREVSQLSADGYYLPSLLLAAERAVQSLYQQGPDQGPVFPTDIKPPRYSEMPKPKKKGPRHFEI